MQACQKRGRLAAMCSMQYRGKLPGNRTKDLKIRRGEMHKAVCQAATPENLNGSAHAEYTVYLHA